VRINAVTGHMSSDVQITMLLQRLHNGDRSAESELLPVVYAQLHHLAELQFRSERTGHTLQPTALISEFYLRIIRDKAIDWQSRAHFYAIASQTIRRILIEHARAAKALRRPNPTKRVEVDDMLAYSDDRAEEILMIDEALTKLKSWDARQSKVVELRFFGGLSVEETAKVLGVAERTVKRDWTLARAWLSSLMNGSETEDSRP
jgi:RNA polymerase sigma-70 factor (ECF subfamily)